MSTYKKLPAVSTGGGGSTDDQTNASTVVGTTTTDALNTLNSDIGDVEFISINTQYKPEPPITLDATDIANKYIVLTEAPRVKNETQMYIINGSAAGYGVDFIITDDDGGKRLSWDGLDLDGIFSIGDQILVIYN